MNFFESIFYMAWRGIAIGLIISAPMGPVGMLCIQRTLDKGRRAGFYTGIGAALSDLFYALLTGFGLSFIEEFLERNSNIIQLAGSVVLIGFGIYLFRKNPTKSLRKPSEETVSVKKSILGGFLFTFSNPLILFLIVGLFARFNFLLPEFKVYQYFTGFAFIFCGALLWWWFITFSISKVRNHFNIRSMWLINRIIGAIIMLFAVVGIFTASSALAKGQDIRCWEPSREKNTSSDSLFLYNPLESPDALEFRLKAHNHKPLADKPWGIALKDSQKGRMVLLKMKSAETEFDGFSTSPALKIDASINDESIFSGLFSDNADILKKVSGKAVGVDPTGTDNFFKVVMYKDLLTLFGGLHSPERLLQIDLPTGFKPDSIGIFLAPGADISLSEMRLSQSRFRPDVIIWDDVDFQNDYLRSSKDAMEGRLQILDKSLDESLLRLGGDYRLWMVRSGDGYDLVYLDGATVNADNWKAGMTKAHLSPSGIEGVWNVDWTDSMFQHLSNDIKAQTDANGTLLIQFPYQNSTLRLHHSTPEAASGR